MARQREPHPFAPRGSSPPTGGGSGGGRSGARGNSRTAAAATQVIPQAVANRMARRIAFATGVPTVLGMGAFVASYLLISSGILAVPPAATLLVSGGFFLLGLVGLSFGVLSASWEEEAGSLLGAEQIPLNLGRIRASLKAMRQGPSES